MCTIKFLETKVLSNILLHTYKNSPELVEEIDEFMHTISANENRRKMINSEKFKVERQRLEDILQGDVLSTQSRERLQYFLYGEIKKN
mmetsp:Transcript_8805/g.7780  ORF Transcript_8805/g.7780 Transcript_8805/m.7780 type:complete len:88 (-) Transcript_8805:29-292(-)